MLDQLIVRLEAETKDKLNRLSRLEGKSTSQVLRDLIEQYIAERDIGAYIDDLWGRIGQTAKTRGFGVGDVDKVIRSVRKERK